MSTTGAGGGTPPFADTGVRGGVGGAEVAAAAITTPRQTTMMPSTDDAAAAAGLPPLPASSVPLIEGLMYRESTVVPGIVKKRYGVLYSDRFCTRAKAEAGEAGFGRVWALSPGCRLSNIKQRKFTVLGTKQHHSLWALISGSYEERELHRFTLHGVLNDSKAALAFESEGDARTWHAAIERALAGLHAAAGRRAPSDLAATETPKADAAAAIIAAARAGNGGGGGVGWRGHLRGRSLGRDLDFAAAAASASGGGTRGSSPAGSATGGGSGWFGGRGKGSRGNLDAASNNRSNSSVAAAAVTSEGKKINVGSSSRHASRDDDDDLLVPTPRLDSSQQLERELNQTLTAPRRPRAAPPGVSMPASPSEATTRAHALSGTTSSSTDDDGASGSDAASSASTSSTTAAATTATAAAAPPPSSSGEPVGLQPWYTEDGVTVYVGRDADGDDVLVESFVVRAPPRLCASTLLRGEVEGGGSAGFGPDPPQLLKVVDAHTQFLRARWSPAGWGAVLAGPRDLILKRTWRRDDDGQYVVLYTSADDDEVRSCSASCSSSAPYSSPVSTNWPWRRNVVAGSVFPPVEGRVLSSGYTFAPLLPEYDPARACAETLVTHVAKLDAGGFVSALRRRGGLPGRVLAAPAWGALLLPLARRSIALKNKAEAERFVARPFLAGSRSATTAATAAAAAARGSMCVPTPSAAAGVGGSSSAASGAAGANAPSPSPAASGHLSARDAAAAERASQLAHTRSIFRRSTSPAVGEKGGNASSSTTSAAAAAASASRAPLSTPPPPSLAGDDDEEEFDDVSEITGEGEEDDFDSEEEEQQQLVAAGGTMPRSMWSCPGAAGFKVRGPTYLEDHRKVPAGEPMLSLAAVDLLHLDAPCFDVARHLASVRRSPAPFMFVVNLMIPGAQPHSVVISWAADRAAPSVGGGASGGNGGGRKGRRSNDEDEADEEARRRASGALSSSSSAPNLSHLGTLARQETAPPLASASKGGVPASSFPCSASNDSPPSNDAAAGPSSSFYQDAHADEDEDDDYYNNYDDAVLPSSPFDLALARFLAGGFGDDTGSEEANARRDGTFKLIPRITEGSWIVKQSVGTTPCLLGHKLAQRYSRGPNYVEVDVDVASSSVAATVVGLVMGATKSVVVDMGIVLEGHSHDELPEALLGTVRLSRVDMGCGRWLDTRTGKLYAEGEKPSWAN